MDESRALSISTLATWGALCKDCRNRKLAEGSQPKRGGDERRQEEFEYSHEHAMRLVERGQSRTDRCPECRRRHRKEISAFPVAYIDIDAIGEAADPDDDPERGPTGPLGGLGPLPKVHTKRIEQVDLRRFELGLTDPDILRLLELMAANQVVILEAGTGTGKSTLAPFRLMNPPEGAVFRPTDSGPIVITEPRVRATRDVAAFVGEAMCFGHDPDTCHQHIGPGYPVGFQCEGEKVWDEACSLIYATDGTVINWLVNGDLARFSVIIIDEAHERSGNIDFILTMLAAQLPRYPHLRVVIASATIDQAYFNAFFSEVPTVRVASFRVDAPKTIGYGVPLFADLEIDENMLARGMQVGEGEGAFSLPGWPDAPNPEAGGRSLREITRDKLAGLRRSAPNWPKQVEKVAADLTLDILRQTDEGGILIFLPTQNSIQTARKEITERLENEDWADTVDVYWLMRATPKEEQKAAVGAVLPGRRKVVVASTIAETSLTIADVRYVIDSGLVQQGRWDPELAVSYGACVPQSQSGVRQRWGRVGRKTHGWVFPLYSFTQFLAMPRETPPGATQMNLESSMLKLFAAGEDPREVAYPVDFVSDAVARDAQGQDVAAGFTRERARAIAALHAGGALNALGDGLSRIGTELARSRLPADQALALMFADRLACAPEVATALVALPMRLAGEDSIFASDRTWPGEWAVHARRCHEALAKGCKDDLELVVRVFAEWRSQPDPERWARQWWINLSALERVRKEASKLIESLAPGMSHEADRSLDLRLVERSRAALSRALPGFRYTRRESAHQPQVWDPVMVGQSAVSVPELHLVPPASDIIALGRTRPSMRNWVSDVGEAFGLVAVRPWALDGDPDELELVVRATTAATELALDEFRPVREDLPVGALLRMDDWSPASTASVQKVSDGLQMPLGVVAVESVAEGSETGAAIVYTTSSDPAAGGSASLDDPVPVDEGPAAMAAADEDIEGDIGDDPLDGESGPPVEVPEEELRLTPVPIRELENPNFESFDHVESGIAHTNESRPVVSFAVEAGLPGPNASALARVVGYERTDHGVVVRVIAVPEHDRELKPGEVLRVAVAMPVRSHFAIGTLLRRLNSDGHVEGDEVAYFDPLLDPLVAPDAEALPVGSEFESIAVPGRRPGEPTKPSVLAAVFNETVGGRGQRSIVNVEATLTGRIHRDWRDVESVLARIMLRSGVRPSILVPRKMIDAAGIMLVAGARVSLGLGSNLFARKTGAWREDDIRDLVDRFPQLFTATANGTKLRLEQRTPLSDEQREQLLEFGGGDPEIEANAWLLWETSRRLRVVSVQAITEADVPDAARHKLSEQALSRFRRQFQVGIVTSSGGAKLKVSGSPEAVEEALTAINEQLSWGRIGFELPRSSDRPPPGAEVVATILAVDPSLDEERVLSWVKRWKVWLPDWYGDSDTIEAALRERYDGVTRILSFPEDRWFYAFQKKERWEQICDGLEVTRQVVTAGAEWAIRAADAAALDIVVARFRAAAPRVPFTAEGDQRSGVKRIEQNHVNAVHVNYFTPVRPAATDGSPPLPPSPASNSAEPSTSAASEGLRPDPAETRETRSAPTPPPPPPQAINSPNGLPLDCPRDAPVPGTSTEGAPSGFEPPDHEDREAFPPENTGRVLPWLRRAFGRNSQGEPPPQRSAGASDSDESTDSAQRTLPWRRRSAR